LIWARQRTRIEVHPSVKMMPLLNSHDRARLADAWIASPDIPIRSILAAKSGRSFGSAVALTATR
jgi:hypothetical protein